MFALCEKNAYRSSPKTRGNHIEVWRGWYWHHGIDLGNGTVIHLSGTPKNKIGASVRRDTLAAFAQGSSVSAVDEDYYILDADEVVALAIRHLGRTGYDLFDMNCEQFAVFCMTGRRTKYVGQIGKFVHDVTRSGLFVPGLEEVPLVGLPIQSGIYAATGLAWGSLIFFANNVIRGLIPVQSGLGFSRQDWDNLVKIIDNIPMRNFPPCRRRLIRRVSEDSAIERVNRPDVLERRTRGFGNRVSVARAAGGDYRRRRS
jgi:hypothetical protein